MKTTVYVLIVIIGGLLFITPKAPEDEYGTKVEKLELSEPEELVETDSIDSTLISQNEIKELGKDSFERKAEKNIIWLKQKAPALDSLIQKRDN